MVKSGEIKNVLRKELEFYKKNNNPNFTICENKGFKKGLNYVLKLINIMEKIDKDKINELNNKHIKAYETLSPEELKTFNDENNNNKLNEWGEVELMIQNIVKSKNITKTQLQNMIEQEYKRYCPNESL